MPCGKATRQEGRRRLDSETAMLCEAIGRLALSLRFTLATTFRLTVSYKNHHQGETSTRYTNIKRAVHKLIVIVAVDKQA